MNRNPEQDLSPSNLHSEIVLIFVNFEIFLYFLSSSGTWWFVSMEDKLSIYPPC